MKHSSAGRLLRGVALVALLGLAVTTLGGCSNVATLEPSSGKLSVVTSVNTWGSLAAEVGGKFVDVKSIINDPRQDPHSYQATVRDQLAVNQADLVIANGAGYDPFIDSLAKSARQHLLLVANFIETPIAEKNPHIWYSIAADIEVVGLLAKRFNAAQPKHAKYFGVNAANLIQRLSKLLMQEKSFKTFALQHKIAAVATEGIADLMLRDCGIKNVTPSAFALAVQNDTEIPPQALAAAKALITNGKVRFLVTNIQVQTPESKILAALAQLSPLRAGLHAVQEVPMSELLPAGVGFVNWIANNLNALTYSAVKAA